MAAIRKLDLPLFDPNNHSFFITIHKNNLPNDTPPQPIDFVLPISLLILFYLVGGALFLLITTQMALLLYFRNHKAIKATSPHLSILIFVGCYLLCFGGLLITTYGSFTFSVLATFLFVYVLAFVFIVNGTSLIIVTITIRLLRVYRIFMCADQFHLGKCWKNVPLILITTLVSLIPNIIIAGIYIGIYLERFLYYASTGLFVLLVLMFSIICFFIAVQMRKIKYKNFKDKSILFLLLFMMINITVTISTVLVIINTNLPIKIQAIITVTVEIVSAQTSATACQLMFTTKLLPVVTLS